MWRSEDSDNESVLSVDAPQGSTSPDGARPSAMAIIRSGNVQGENFFDFVDNQIESAQTS